MVAAGIVVWKMAWWHDVQDNSNQMLEGLPDLPTAEDLFGDAGNQTYRGALFDFIQCDGGQNNTTSQSHSETATCCNGLTSNCDLRINEVMFATMHNAMSTADEGYFRPNHDKSMELALEAGFRAFELDICNCDSGGGVKLKFCHGYCHLGSTEISDKMSNVATFLQNNPTEVLVLDFQFPEGSTMDYVDKLYNILLNVTGMEDLLYILEASDQYEWPLMSDLVQSNKRLILFQHDAPDTTKNNYTNYPALHNFFLFTSRNDFVYETSDELLNFTRSCAYGSGNANRAFYLLNHFVTFLTAQKEDAVIVNSHENILNHVGNCTGMNNDQVNFISIDFWSLSDLPEFVQKTNIIRAASKSGRNLQKIKSSTRGYLI